MGRSQIRRTRKLRTWMVEQVSSGKYPGLVWHDDAKTMFRIPWKHAGKQDFRSDEDAAIFKAWAVFKGKMTDDHGKDPATWKTRMRCALNKSNEFEEMADRSQLDISEPYKVYRLVPVEEQGDAGLPKCNGLKPRRAGRAAKRLRRASGSTDEDEVLEKQIKEEAVTVPLCVEDLLQREDLTEVPQIIIPQGAGTPTHSTFRYEDVEEFQLDVRIETNPSPPLEEDSFHVAVSYSGQEVLRRVVQGADVRIALHDPSPLPPTPGPLMERFPCIDLLNPPADPDAAPELLRLLPGVEKGVALTTTNMGVFVTRFCQGPVFWIGPHATAAAAAAATRWPGEPLRPCNIPLISEPVLIFSKEVFRQQLEAYQEHGGEPPACDVTLCFGEELLRTDDLSKKHIVAKITFPWAEKQVQNVISMISILHSLTSPPNGEITIDLIPLEEASYTQTPHT